MQRRLLRAGAARALLEGASLEGASLEGASEGASLEGASDAAGRAAWRLRCMLALHELARGGDVDVQRELLQAGLIESALGLCAWSERRERNLRSARSSPADEAGGVLSGAAAARRVHRRGDEP